MSFISVTSAGCCVMGRRVVHASGVVVPWRLVIWAESWMMKREMLMMMQENQEVSG